MSSRNDKYFVAHPNNVRKLRAATPIYQQPTISNPTYMGLELIESRNVPEFAATGKWKFPEDRFVEYEESDEAWAKPLKFGEPEMGPVFWMMDRDVKPLMSKHEMIRYRPLYDFSPRIHLPLYIVS